MSAILEISQVEWWHSSLTEFILNKKSFNSAFCNNTILALLNAARNSIENQCRTEIINGPTKPHVHPCTGTIFKYPKYDVILHVK